MAPTVQRLAVGGAACPCGDNRTSTGELEREAPAVMLLGMAVVMTVPLLHGAEDYVAGHGADRAAGLQAVGTTLLDAHRTPG